jgi:hypothetical protein
MTDVCAARKELKLTKPEAPVWGIRKSGLLCQADNKNCYCTLFERKLVSLFAREKEKNDLAYSLDVGRKQEVRL